MALELISRQKEVGEYITKLYNELGQLAKCSVLGEDVMEKINDIYISFTATKGEFEANDKELQSPSHTLSMNPYYKGSFVSEVRDVMEKFRSLYDVIVVKAGGARTASTLTLNEFPLPGNFASGGAVPKVMPTVTKTVDDRKIAERNSASSERQRSRNSPHWLESHFKYSLSDLEFIINEAMEKDISREEVREVFNTAQTNYFEYSKEFGEDELTELFFALKDKYQMIPRKEFRPMTLPFSLPSVEIPVFNGKMEEWETFRELFEQLVIGQPISKTQKMCILKAKVSGEARRKISKLPATEEYFETAWNILKDHYSNKRAATSIYFRSILDAPSVAYNSQSVKRFVDVVGESLQALETTRIDAQELYHSFVCYVLQRKLDENLRIQFEQSVGAHGQLPKVDDLMNFLRRMQYSLEASQQFSGYSGKQKSGDTGSRWGDSSRTQSQKVNEDRSDGNAKGQYEPREKCPLGCAVGHFLNRCSKFRVLPIEKKWNIVLEKNRCSRCLASGHFKSKCTSNINCRTCQGEHNSLLHKEKVCSKSTVVNNKHCEDTCVLLSTASVLVKDREDKWVQCRALLDSGSQVCLMTKALKDKLKLNGTQSQTEVEGLSRNRSLCQEKVEVMMKSKTSKYKTNLNALVITTILSNVPETRVVADRIPQELSLADPKYNIPNGIDLLVGAEIFYEILVNGKIKSGASILQNTKLGWIVSGPATIDKSSKERKVVATIQTRCDELLKKFWEIEEIPRAVKLTSEEKRCEELFEEGVRRAEDGKFEVRLPFKQNVEVLGSSGVIAKRRFMALEKKLNRNADLRIQYHDFLRKYLELGHMEVVKDIRSVEGGYYLPHHCVLRPESSTTKLRVVFDASCKTSTSYSLNNILYTGPRIQDELFGILLRFRKYKYVFAADIEKMYRQIWVANSDRKFQLIYWRFNANEEVRTFALNTVTYGTACAPYLAVKCLQRIADLKEATHPNESQAIRSDFYMDDLMTGGDCLGEVVEMRRNLEAILLEFGMPLRKWCANNSQILEGIAKENIEGSLNIEDEELPVKALGVMWCPRSDVFSLKYKTTEDGKFSKRSILSETAKLFDPLGFVGPVIVSAKILLQDLWKLKMDWDDEVPMEIGSTWSKIKKELVALNYVKIGRHMICCEPKRVELIGFSDASMRAYGAVVYLKSINALGDISVRLVASKSRVAPTKIVTLPRLELCAAALLVELVSKIKENFQIKIDNVFYYTDSTIVLNWIRIDPARLQVFVSNRVNDIQTKTIVANWRHVSSQQNPADLLSRGVFPKEMLDHKNWFEGPAFLKESYLTFVEPEQLIEIPELKKMAKVGVVVKGTVVWEKINHRNKFAFLRNVIAWVLKFVNIARKGPSKSFIIYKKEALRLIVHDIQRDSFAQEISALKKGANVTKSSHLRTLCPFLDSDGILRVGGRLQNSNLSFEAKHPMILPYKNRVVELMLEEVHIEKLHIGPQGLLAIFRQQFWPLRGRQLVRKVVSKCYRCFRAEPRNLHQFMGNLPEDRVIRTRPFLNTGIDFLGPIIIHYKIRGKKTDKAYVCVFVCFATKAVHLEVVSDLTAAAFIGALKRFVARRGCPLKIYSDNGTNFVGAANSLHEVYELFRSSDLTKDLDEYCAQRDIEWLNIPAKSPHIGGLWESCVKSVKRHINRVVEGTMTFEEMSTLMAQIESVLNSRPLTPLSDDPNDFSVLTPSHFLIGECFSTVIDGENNKSYQGLRGHWRDVQARMEEFWDRWSNEYLSELQRRYKWVEKSKNIKPGTLVLLKEDNLPPLCWRRGRVIRTRMGSDGLCRMIDVRTSNGETKRSVHNVCPFPIDEEVDNEGSDKSTIIRNKKTINESVKSAIIMKKERKNNVKSKNMFIVMLFMLAIFKPIRAKVEIVNFTDKSGVFFEEVAVVGLTKTSWNIVAHANMAEYVASVKACGKAVEKLNVEMQNIPDMKQVRVIQQLREAHNHIINQHELIMSSAPVRRNKRSALPFVGGILRSLFGLMDEEHADELVRRINLGDANQSAMLELINNQTSLQDITARIIKEQNQAVFKNIEKLRESSELLQKKIGTLENREVIILRITELLATLQEVESIQRDLIDVMVNIRGSFLHEILPLKTFKQQIRIINSSVGKKLHLPTESPMELAQIAHVTTRTTQEYMLFNIRLPLINVDHFLAYAVQAYPIIHDGMSVQLNTHSNYLMINEEKTLFYTMKEDEFTRCQKIKDLTICPQIHPIYNARESSECEVKLFVYPKVFPDSCEFAITKFRNFWKQLHVPNAWVFSITKGSSTDIKCDGNRQDIVLQDQGLLRMQPGCTLETEEMKLWAHETYKSNVNYIFPHLNISSSLPPLTHLQLKNDIEIYKLPDIPKVNTFLGFPVHLDTHHLTHYSLSFTTCIVITGILVALFFVIKKLCHLSSRYLPVSIALPQLR